MNRKLVFHLCVFAALLCLAAIIWNGLGDVVTGPTQAEYDKAAAEGRLYEDPLSGEQRIEGWEQKGITESGKILVGIVLLIAVAGYGAIFFIAFILPNVINRFAFEIYGSEEEVEADLMHDARALFAQGDFVGAIAAYREVAAEQPENRFPWVEISKIQHDNLEDPDAAIRTLRQALESSDWRVNDAAFFMFRLAEMYENDKRDSEKAVSILEQVVDTFPDTRHAANATHRLRELGAV